MFNFVLRLHFGALIFRLFLLAFIFQGDLLSFIPIAGEFSCQKIREKGFH